MTGCCPTCGGTGPDVADRVGDYGGDTWELRCGDDWHEGKAAPALSDTDGQLNSQEDVSTRIDENTGREDVL